MAQILDVLRQENKYLISFTEARRLNKLFSKVLRQDSFNQDNGYLVRSLYFDSVFDDDYYDKHLGIEYRKKIRIRVYSPDDNKGKLEMKEKRGNNQRKRSLTISREQVNEIVQGNFNSLLSFDQPFANELYLLLNEQVYRPKCIVEYDRRAFSVPENNIRLTLDMNIRATESNFNLFDKDMNLFPVTSLDNVTLEVKFNNFLLQYIKDLLEASGAAQVSNSKYILARSITYF